MTNLENILINEGLTVIKKGNEYLIRDFTGKEIKMIQNNGNVQIFDINGNSEKCDIYDLNHIRFATFSALEGEYKSNAIDYVDEYLLNCETNQQDMLVNVRGQMEDIEIIDVIGLVEEKGRIYVGLEVEYEEYCYLVNVNLMNAWDFVYKDEMIEIQDLLSDLISAQLKIDLDIQ